MSKQPAPPATSLRIYPSRFTGPVLLVCRKCEKKLKKSGIPLKVKKSLKQLARQDANPHPIQIIYTGCMDLCPKGAATACPPSQLTHTSPNLVTLRTQHYIANLYKQCQSSADLIN
jgi:hypothetical protein